MASRAWRSTHATAGRARACARATAGRARPRPAQRQRGSGTSLGEQPARLRPSTTSSRVPPLSLAMTGMPARHRLEHRVGRALVRAEHDRRGPRLARGRRARSRRRGSAPRGPRAMPASSSAYAAWRGSTGPTTWSCGARVTRRRTLRKASTIVAMRLLGAIRPFTRKRGTAPSAAPRSRRARRWGSRSTRRHAGQRARRVLHAPARRGAHGTPRVEAHRRRRPVAAPASSSNA